MALSIGGYSLVFRWWFDAVDDVGGDRGCLLEELEAGLLFESVFEGCAGFFGWGVGIGCGGAPFGWQKLDPEVVVSAEAGFVEDRARVKCAEAGENEVSGDLCFGLGGIARPLAGGQVRPRAGRAPLRGVLDRFAVLLRGGF